MYVCVCVIALQLSSWAFRVQNLFNLKWQVNRIAPTLMKSLNMLLMGLSVRLSAEQQPTTTLTTTLAAASGVRLKL